MNPYSSKCYKISGKKRSRRLIGSYTNTTEPLGKNLRGHAEMWKMRRLSTEKQLREAQHRSDHRQNTQGKAA